MGLSWILGFVGDLERGVSAVVGRRTKAAGAVGDGAPVSAAFLCAPVCREPIARTDIDGEKYLAAIVIWQ